MMSYSDYFKIIDEIRVAKDFTVEELCDGIISERTYYRHLVSNKGIKFDIFSKLAKRLKIKAYDLIHYSVFVRKGDPGITKFIYRMEIKYYGDIHELYEVVKNHKNDNPELDQLLKVYIKKYEYLFNKVDYNEYLDMLEYTMELFKDKPLKNDSVAAFNTLYLLEHPINDKVSLEDTVKHYIEADFRIGVAFKMAAYDKLLSLMIEYGNLDNELFEQLTNKMNQLLPYYNHKYYTYRNDLFNAYIGKITSDSIKQDRYLMRHIMGLVILIGNEGYDKGYELVRDTFGVEPISFLKEKSSEFFESKQFVIKKITK